MYNFLTFFRLYERQILYYLAPIILGIHVIYGHVPVVSALCSAFYLAMMTRPVWSFILGDLWEIMRDRLRELFIDIRLGVNSALKPESFSFNSLAVNFNKHKIGIAACVKTAVSSDDVTSVASELVKTGSMLGLEQTILDTLISKVATATILPDDTIIQQSADYEGLIPLLASGATIIGKDIGGLDLNNFLDKYAKNIRSIETIQTQIQKSLELLGYRTNPCYSVLMDINKELVELKPEVSWAVVTLATRPNEFIKTDGATRLKLLYDKVQALSTRLNTITDSKIRTQKLAQDCSQVMKQVEDVYNQAKIIKTNYGIRPCPVGIALCGESQIGKTEIMPELLRKVRANLSRRDDNPFIDVDSWQTWHVQTRDEYDTNYTGQEITYADDAFQDKTNKDHPMWITFISSDPVGTVQADLKTKGMPFNSRICAVTTNTWPVTSVTIQTPEALQGRFPISVHVSLKPGARKPGNRTRYDSSFDWLQFRLGSMISHIRNGSEAQALVSIDDIAEIIADKLVINEVKYQEKMASLQRIQLQSDVESQVSDMAESIDSDEMEIIRNNIDESRFNLQLPRNFLQSDSQETDLERVQNIVATQTSTSTPSLQEDRDMRMLFNEMRRLAGALNVATISDSANSDTEAYEGLWTMMVGSASNNLQHVNVGGYEVAERLLTDASNHVFDQSRIAMQGEPATWLSLGEWVTCIRQRSSGMTLEACQASNPMSVGEFLMQLGAWEVDPSKQEAFIRSWCAQRIIKIEDENVVLCGLPYLWGPLLNQGNSLVAVNDRLAMHLGIVLAPGEGAPTLRHRINSWLLLNQRSLIDTTITAGSIALGFTLPPVANDIAFLMGALRVRLHTAVLSRTRSLFSLWNRMSMPARVLLCTPPMVITETITHLYTYIDEICERCCNSIHAQVLRLLEMLGVDVTDLWNTIIGISTKVILKSTLVLLMGVMIYLLYKLLSNYFYGVAKPEEPKNLDKKPIFKHKNSSAVYWCSKGEKEPTRAKITRKHKIAKIRLESDQWTLACLSSQCGTNHQPDDKNHPGVWVMGSKHNGQYRFEGDDIAEEINWFCDCVGMEDKSIALTMSMDNTPHPIMIMTQTDEVKRVEAESDSKLIKLHSVSFLDHNSKNSKGIDMECEFTTSWDDLPEKLNHWFKIPLRFNVWDFTMKILISKIEGLDEYHVGITLFSPSALIKDVKRGYTQKSLANLRDTYNEFNEIKVDTNKKTIDEIIEEKIQHDGNTEQSLSSIKSIVKHHQVYYNGSPPFLWDSDEVSGGSFALGHRRMLIHVAHNLRKNQIIRWWRGSKPTSSRGFRTAMVVALDTVRDVAFSQILTVEQLKEVTNGALTDANLVHISKINDSFPDIKKYLLPADACRTAAFSAEVVMYLPLSQIYTTGQIEYSKVKNYSPKEISEPYDYHRITALRSDTAFSAVGDCGGPYVIAHGRYQGRLIGIHAASSPVMRFWLAAILTTDDVTNIESYMPIRQESPDSVDPWQALLVKGTPTDLPAGPAVKYLGKFKYRTLPAVSVSLDHWNPSPWFSQFEERMGPGPLSAYDDRIKIDLPKNLEGEPSLLLHANNILGQELPEMDDSILFWIGEKFIEEQVTILKNKIKPTPAEFEALMDHALNGFDSNEFVGGIELNKASGLPWSYYKGCQKKSDLIDMDDMGVRSFNDTTGRHLRNRIAVKLRYAMAGKRVLSFSNSKLKDTTIKNKHIENGKTRVFHCIPVDKIILDAALFGSYKEAYSAAGLNLNHGIGVDPHSIGWRAIYEKISKHPNVFDADFEHYDKRLSAQVMNQTYRIIRRVIQRVRPDTYSMARRVLAEESVNTVVVDYDTVYLTSRGNKSGEYMTTIVNCIANDIYSFYCWIKLTGITSLSEFRENVSEIFFGDDRLSSVSDKYAHMYNFKNFKTEMELIGHKVTPGDKSEMEPKFMDIEKVQFLKRRFSFLDGMIVGPLVQESIESPFTWTRIHTREYLIWYNLVKEQRYEALLHGKAYYDEFIDKLRCGCDSHLQREIDILLVDSYEDMLDLYRQMYYGKR